ncbi:ArnT family glycosyltransferase [Vibrio sp. SCSIO 43137]|uniref:ArnT family glycosyltransferase n=1 Tax=Vibrio sp. SCSIO 43137 TaxID=3021011 RepID=UPI0023074DFF|nr:glycosyltransferase family 39 protein [Vibrio sp. SCSIO 43137]WCE28680.1 glycosyltransferase family 39 protein [Vibrio sp. SCSIO 43137]
MTINQMSENNIKGSMLKPLLIILFLISIFRGYTLSISTLDLYVDEIQYWWWSLELDWGYYSKPPMVAVLIYLVTSLFGHSVFTIKLGAVLIYPLTSYIIYLLGQKLISEKVGFWAAVLFITLPGVALSSTITSTDVLLFLFWSSAMLFFLRSIETNSWFDWIMCAVVCGLGLLTKYNMAIFSLSALGYMLFFGHARQLKNPRLWVMAAISLLILAPNFYWNYLNDFPTFAHTADYVDKQGLYPKKMMNFIFEQAGILGPVGFIVLWWWLIKGEKPRNLLINFSMPMLVIISLVALQGKYNANWAAPTYVAAIIGIAHFLQPRKKWLIAMLATNLILGLVVHLGDPVIKAAGIELEAGKDPFKRVRGWKEWGEEVKVFTDKYPQDQLIVDGRTAITEAAFYVFDKPNERLVAWWPRTIVKSHFELTRPYLGSDAPALFLTDMGEGNVQRYFTEVELLAPVNRRLSKNKTSDYDIYRVSGFKGYNK